jgi:WD40-like Beta Propeller Repeat
MPRDTGLLLSVGGGPHQPSRMIATENIDGMAYRALALGGMVSEPAVSAMGAIAFVRTRRGRQLVMLLDNKRHATPRKLAVGRSPTFSADGERIAYVNRGWVRVISANGGRSRRLVRGAPAWSPSGRWIAFILGAGSVRIVPAAGGRSHALANVTGTHIDWQPVVHSALRCAVPPRSAVEGHGPGVTLYEDGDHGLPTAGRSSLASPLGGRLRFLAPGSWHSAIGLGDFRFTGPLAAYAWTQGEDFPPCFPPEGYLNEVDLATGALLMSDHVQQNGLTAPDRLDLYTWVLATSGAIAYLTSYGPAADYPGPYSYMVTAHDSGGIRVLDEVTTDAPSDPLTNLSVSGNTIYWDHDAQRRSATVGGPP